MAIDEQLVLDKLQMLEDYIRQVERMEFTAEELDKSKDIQDLISFRLQQAVETSIDIANHIAAGLALPQQDTAVDVMQLLAEEGIISKELASEMADATRFRNLIVHHYGKIDFQKVYRSYKDDLNDLRKFAKEIYEFVQKETSGNED